jgi:hypothetical protein
MVDDCHFSSLLFVLFNRAKRDGGGGGCVVQ